MLCYSSLSPVHCRNSPREIILIHQYSNFPVIRYISGNCMREISRKVACEEILTAFAAGYILKTMASIEELKKDIEELQKFLDEAESPRVKSILSMDIRKLSDQVSLKQETETGTTTSTTVPRRPHVYTHQITTYAWDQSDNYMKLYVTLNGVHSIPAENVTSEFTNRSLKLFLKDLNGKNHELLIARLAENIKPGESYHKVKTDMVLLMLKKKDSGKTWAHVKESEKPKESKKPTFDDKDDPNASIMKLMQNMYEEGDDEMKRTIAKAWTESRDKQSSF